MRTSDWSSDVCSSDLKCADFFRRDGTRRAAGDLGTMKAIERALASQPFVPEPIEERPHRRQFPRGRCIRKPSNTDRKSVVEGQSESVRVDLGGVRIMKKKNSILEYNILLSLTSLYI